MAKLIKNRKGRSTNPLARTGKLSTRGFPKVRTHYQAPESDHVVTASRLQQHYFMINNIRCTLRHDQPAPWQFEYLHQGRTVEFDPSVTGDAEESVVLKSLTEYRSTKPYRAVHPDLQTQATDAELASLDSKLANLSEVHGMSSSKLTLLNASKRAAKTLKGS